MTKSKKKATKAKKPVQNTVPEKKDPVEENIIDVNAGQDNISISKDNGDPTDQQTDHIKESSEDDLKIGSGSDVEESKELSLKERVEKAKEEIAKEEEQEANEEVKEQKESEKNQESQTGSLDTKLEEVNKLKELRPSAYKKHDRYKIRWGNVKTVEDVIILLKAMDMNFHVEEGNKPPISLKYLVKIEEEG